MLHPVEWHAKKDWGSNSILHEKDNSQEIKAQNDNANHDIPYMSNTSLALSSPNLPAILQSSEFDPVNVRKENSNIFKNIKKTVIDIFSNLLVLRNTRALILSFGLAFTLSGYINFVMMIPFILQNKGFSLGQSAWCISTGAIFNMVARLIMSPASDHPKFNKRICYMSGSAIACTSTISK